jgi:type I restriction enzyme, S subunit
MNNEAKELLDKHFDLAFTAPNGVQKLRELILTFAMQGKLVSQDPNDQTASELLKEIQTEKQELEKEGKNKNPKPLPEVKLEEPPYELPQGWEWVRLDDISVKIHYGYTASANHNLTNTRLLRISDIQDNKVDWESVPGCDIQDSLVQKSHERVMR